MAWRIAGLYVVTVLAGILTAMFAIALFTEDLSGDLSRRVQNFPFDRVLSDQAGTKVRISTAIGDRILSGEVDDALAISCFLIEIAMADLDPDTAADDGWRELNRSIRQNGLDYIERARAAGKCERTWEEERGLPAGLEQ